MNKILFKILEWAYIILAYLGAIKIYKWIHRLAIEEAKLLGVKSPIQFFPLMMNEILTLILFLGAYSFFFYFIHELLLEKIRKRLKDAKTK